MEPGVGGWCRGAKQARALTKMSLVVKCRDQNRKLALRKKGRERDVGVGMNKKP